MTAPHGGLLRMSRRVMNLAHMVTQNARRHGDRTGFVWADKSWTWSEIDRLVSALAAALAARGVVKGDRVLVSTPGGGGYGPARARDRALRLRDRLLGYIGRGKA